MWHSDFIETFFIYIKETDLHVPLSYNDVKRLSKKKRMFLQGIVIMKNTTPVVDESIDHIHAQALIKT